jgi:hypothetical protein
MADRRAMTDDSSDWIDRRALGETSTVCVAANLTLSEALDSYGADLGRRLPAPAGEQDCLLGDAVWLLPVERGIIAVEANGFQATRRAVLRRLSAHGRVASCGFSASMLPYLSFADRGHILAAFEAGVDPISRTPSVAAAMEGIDLHDGRRGWGLSVLRRFTGHAVSEDRFRSLLSEGVHHRLVPHLDDLTERPTGPDGRPARLGAHGPLGPGTDHLLDSLSSAQLREHAWWIAGQLMDHYRVADDPAIARTLITRRLDDTATNLARTNRLSDGRSSGDDNLWRALHTATHPDARAAVLDLLLIADYVMACDYGPDRRGWPALARRRLAPASTL